MTTLTAPVSASDTTEAVFISFRVPQIRTQEDFYLFCQENTAHRFERETDGTIVIMPNTGGKPGCVIPN